MWSPQLYKQEGLAIGRTDELLENAIHQSNESIYSPYNLPSILSLNHLAKRTGVNYAELRSYVDRTSFDGYNKFSIRKRSGGRRYIYAPNPNLMHVQRWINEYILKPLPVHSASHAFTVGSSIQKCAARHCGAKWLIKLDIQDFFESISEIQVFRLFKELKYRPLVAFELARLCTIKTPWQSPRQHYEHWAVWNRNIQIGEYNQRVLGYVPQGAVTSPLLSNLVMRDCDIQLSNIATRFGLTYTRYSDDLQFSTRSKSFNRAKAKSFIYEAYKILSKAGYRPQYRKTKIIPPRSKKIVLGLNVDGSTPKLQKEFKDSIRQHLYYLNKFGIDAHVTRRGFDSIWGFKSHLRGKIDFAKMIEPEYAEQCLNQFNALDWPV